MRESTVSFQNYALPRPSVKGTNCEKTVHAHCCGDYVPELEHGLLYGLLWYIGGYDDYGWRLRCDVAHDTALPNIDGFLAK